MVETDKLLLAMYHHKLPEPARVMESCKLGEVEVGVRIGLGVAVAVIAPHMVGEMEAVVVAGRMVRGRGVVFDRYTKVELVVNLVAVAVNLAVEEVKVGLEVVVAKIQAVVEDMGKVAVESECNILEVVEVMLMMEGAVVK